MLSILKMGTDLFIDYSCPFRKGGDAGHVHYLLRLKRRLDDIESGRSAASTVRVEVRESGGVREQVFTHADLKLAGAKLGEVYPVCDGCPANLKKAFGIRGSIGCHAHVDRPLDDFAERILHETLVENARPERRETEQSNLMRGLLGSTRANGKYWKAAIGQVSATDDASEQDGWGTRPVTVLLDNRQYRVTVYALLELLFMFPRFPLRAVEDILSFFRSFFAVVGGYVSTSDGKLDQRLNERFWRKSAALNELNLYIQLLKHAARLGRGINVLSE